MTRHRIHPKHASLVDHHMPDWLSPLPEQIPVSIPLRQILQSEDVPAVLHMIQSYCLEQMELRCAAFDLDGVTRWTLWAAALEAMMRFGRGEIPRFPQGEQGDPHA